MKEKSATIKKINIISDIVLVPKMQKVKDKFPPTPRFKKGGTMNVHTDLPNT